MTAPDSEALADLLRRASAGDESALGQLLQRYERRVRLAARSLLRHPLRHLLDSLDLVQSVHRAMVPGLREGRYTFSDEDQLVALAVTVLRHKVLRNAQRTRLAPPPPPAPTSMPHETAAARDLLSRLLADLTDADRRIVEMRLEGFATAEIAASLECTPAIVRARLSRLRRRLREAGYVESI